LPQIRLNFFLLDLSGKKMSSLQDFFELKFLWIKEIYFPRERALLKVKLGAFCSLRLRVYRDSLGLVKHGF